MVWCERENDYEMASDCQTLVRYLKKIGEMSRLFIWAKVPFFRKRGEDAYASRLVPD